MSAGDNRISETAKAPSSRFWDFIAKRYARQPVADEAAYQRKLEVTRQSLKPDMQLLEFGCGTGSTALVHAPLVRHIRAIDISAKMLAIARSKAEAGQVENVTFEQAAIDTFTAPDGHFDAVLGLSILHLLADKEAVIAKVHGMLKPGGVFVTSTVCLGDTMAFFRFIAPVGHFLGLLPLLKVFTVQDLVDSLSGAGFVIDHQWQPSKGKAVFIVARKPL
jgi:ubiquinone/menaquinone biosynthesis C-methylase UbiE